MANNVVSISMLSGQYDIYRQTSYIRRTLVGNDIIDHSDVVGASPVGAAPTTSFSTYYLASVDRAKATTISDGKYFSPMIWGVLYQMCGGKRTTPYPGQCATALVMQPRLRSADGDVDDGHVDLAEPFTFLLTVLCLEAHQPVQVLFVSLVRKHRLGWFRFLDDWEEK